MEPVTQTRNQLHKTIKAASNTKILRRQMELLAEYSRLEEGSRDIPSCSREMVRIYRELLKAKSVRALSLAAVVCLVSCFLHSKKKLDEREGGIREFE